MFKSKTKYKWEGWKSSGNEAGVFDVEHPRELMGVHAKLIDNQLKEPEKVEYCLYSPRLHSTSTPFGLKTKEASSGLCITDNRFIISQNSHIDGVAPAVTTIDFREITYINIGSALLLGWFSISYARDANIQNIAILFKATGRHHFEKCMRSFTKYNVAAGSNKPGVRLFPASGFIPTISDTNHRERMKNLIDPRGLCVLTFPCHYLCYKSKKRRFLSFKEEDYCVTSNATVLLTAKALLLARDSLRFSIGSSVDILNIPLEKIAAITRSIENAGDCVIHTLKIHLDTVAKNSALNISLIAQNEDIEVYINKIVSFLKGDSELAIV